MTPLAETPPSHVRRNEIPRTLHEVGGNDKPATNIVAEDLERRLSSREKEPSFKKDACRPWRQGYRRPRAQYKIKPRYYAGRRSNASRAMSPLSELASPLASFNVRQVHKASILPRNFEFSPISHSTSNSLVPQPLSPRRLQPTSSNNEAAHPHHLGPQSPFHYSNLQRGGFDLPAPKGPNKPSYYPTLSPGYRFAIEAQRRREFYNRASNGSYQVLRTVTDGSILENTFPTSSNEQTSPILPDPMPFPAPLTDIPHPCLNTDAILARDSRSMALSSLPEPAARASVSYYDYSEPFDEETELVYSTELRHSEPSNTNWRTHGAPQLNPAGEMYISYPLSRHPREPWKCQSYSRAGVARSYYRLPLQPRGPLYPSYNGPSSDISISNTSTRTGPILSRKFRYPPNFDNCRPGSGEGVRSKTSLPFDFSFPTHSSYSSHETHSLNRISHTTRSPRFQDTISPVLMDATTLSEEQLAQGACHPMALPIPQPGESIDCVSVNPPGPREMPADAHMLSEATLEPVPLSTIDSIDPAGTLAPNYNDVSEAAGAVHDFEIEEELGPSIAQAMGFIDLDSDDGVSTISRRAPEHTPTRILLGYRQTEALESTLPGSPVDKYGSPLAETCNDPGPSIREPPFETPPNSNHNSSETTGQLDQFPDTTSLVHGEQPSMMAQHSRHTPGRQGKGDMNHAGIGKIKGIARALKTRSASIKNLFKSHSLPRRPHSDQGTYETIVSSGVYIPLAGESSLHANDVRSFFSEDSSCLPRHRKIRKRLSSFRAKLTVPRLPFGKRSITNDGSSPCSPEPITIGNVPSEQTKDQKTTELSRLELIRRKPLSKVKTICRGRGFPLHGHPVWGMPML